jgi:hypothetical protein
MGIIGEYAMSPLKILAQLTEANLPFIGFQLPFKLTYIANGFGAIGPLTLPGDVYS